MKLKYVEVLHPFNISGAVSAEITISAAKYPGIKITLGDGLVRVEHKGKVGLIPLSNIRGMVLEDEPRE